MGRRFRHVFAAVAQPLLHEFDFITLRRVDASGNVDQLRSVRTISHQGRHFQGLVVMRDHVLHEAGISGRVAGVRYRDCFFGAEFTRRFSRRSWVNYRRLALSQTRHHVPKKKHSEQNPGVGPLYVSGHSGNSPLVRSDNGLKGSI